MIGTMSQEWVARVASVGATIGASGSSTWTGGSTPLTALDLTSNVATRRNPLPGSALYEVE